MLVNPHVLSARRNNAYAAMRRSAYLAAAHLRASGGTEAEVLHERVRLMRAGSDLLTKIQIGGEAEFKGELIRSNGKSLEVERRATSLHRRADEILARARAIVSSAQVNDLRDQIDEFMRMFAYKKKPNADELLTTFFDYEERFDDAKGVFDVLDPDEFLANAQTEYEAEVGAALEDAKRAETDYRRMKDVYAFSKNINNVLVNLQNIQAQLDKFGYLQRKRALAEGEHFETTANEMNDEVMDALNLTSAATRSFAGPTSLVVQTNQQMVDVAAAVADIRTFVPSAPAVPKAFALSSDFRAWVIRRALGLPVPAETNSPITAAGLAPQIRVVTGFVESRDMKKDTIHRLGSLLCVFAYIRQDVFFSKLDEINNLTFTPAGQTAVQNYNFTPKTVLARLLGAPDDKEDPESFHQMSVNTVISEPALVHLFVGMMGYMFETADQWDKFHEDVENEWLEEEDMQDRLRSFFVRFLLNHKDMLGNELYSKVTWIRTDVATLEALFDILRQAESLDGALTTLHGGFLLPFGDWM